MSRALNAAGAAACARAALLVVCLAVAGAAGAQSVPVTLEVPFVPQTEDLCGGAATAMVFRYWGDTHAPARQFEPLVDRRAGGIADTVLVAAIRERQWNAERIAGSVAVLRDELAARRPLMLLLEDRPGRYHYVVAVGVDDRSVLIHDPTWGPDRRYGFETLQRAWQPSGFWTLRITPTRATPMASRSAPSTVQPLAEPRPPSGCDARMEAALDTLALRGLDVADTALAPLIEACPTDPRPLRELAGVRFAQRRWTEASDLAAAALARDPRDAYAADVLGSARFMVRDETGALRAWNRTGTPTLDSVRITGLSRTRYAQVTEALGLPLDGVLAADTFALARRRLQHLPSFRSARLSLQPLADHYAAVDIAVVERGGVGRGFAPWAVALARAGLEREASITLPGWSGQGDAWSAGVQWWQRRPAAWLSYAAPFTAGPRGIWRVNGGWTRQTYGPGATEVEEDRRTGSIGVSSWVRPNLRADVALSLDSWQVGAERWKSGAVHGGIEQRLLQDRLSLAADASRWVRTASHRPFGAASVSLRARSAAEPRPFVLTATAGSAVASQASPPALWSGAGDGRARTPLLRAHRLLDEGRVDGAVFGRRLLYASLEAQHWLPRPGVVRLGAAAFVDAARATGRPEYARGRGGQVDIGVGLRVRPPGDAGSLRVDYAHGARDGANRVFIGWQPNRVPGLSP